MRCALPIAALIVATAACSPLDDRLPAVVAIYCGEDRGTGWAAANVAVWDGWHSFVITSYDVVDDCVGGDPGTLDAEGIIRNRIGLVRVQAGSHNLLGHVWSWSAADDLAAVVVRESLDTLPDGSPPHVGDRVAIGSRTGVVTRADREALLAAVALVWTDRGAPVLNGDNDVIGTVVVEEGSLRAVALPLVCRSLLECTCCPEASWPEWP